MTKHSPLSRLGAILKLLREEKGLDVEQLAELSGIDVTMLREIEETPGVTPIHVSHLDSILSSCGLRLRDLARAERHLIASGATTPIDGKMNVDTLLETIERQQEEIEVLEDELDDRESAKVREFQMQSIRLLERTMESSGMSREDMRRLVSDMYLEEVS